MKSTFSRHAVSLVVACALSVSLPIVALGQPKGPVRVACLGDSITAGARVDAKTESYPARLQELLGDGYEVTNFGVGGATLIKTGRPNVWQKLDDVRQFQPQIAVIALGTNDTVGGKRKNWEQIGRFDDDCAELIAALAELPTKPRIVLCTPTAMVLATKGLSEDRLANLTERKPRLQELCKRIRKLAARHADQNVTLLELNDVLQNHPELLTEGDGVHPNADGYLAIAKAVAEYISAGASHRAGGPTSLNDVFAPVVVGTPPVNAFNGLFRCPDGEIRHYGDDGFIFSRDNGLTWKHRRFGELDASGKPAGGGRPLGMNPETGTCLQMVGGSRGTFVHRSTDGPDGRYIVVKVDDRRMSVIRPPYFLRSRPRVLFAAQSGYPHRITVFRSDDDGRTWAKTDLPVGPAFVIEPPHQGPRWENWCVEPTLLELKNGRLWMLARTSRDTPYECFSEDGGETWSAWEPSRFYGTLTMPTLFRLSDGRVLLLWCNTTPLPEIDRSDEAIPETAKNGRWEDVFTNRDACHAAISEDDGRTWIGFREMRLNPLRNAGDFGDRADYDYSVHQSQALELPGGKVLVAHGQDEEVRALVIFDTRWLYEPRRRSTFENGLADWSTQKYIKGIVGHCAYNRVPGARLVPHPDKAGAQVLQIRHPLDPKLVFDKDGAVWNFPAAVKGSFRTQIKLLPGGGGGRICLVDRWFNPTDPVVQDYSMYVLTIPGDGRLTEDVTLAPGRWHDLRFDWDDSQASKCRLTIDDSPDAALTLPLVRPSVNGISYVHFQALSDKEDPEGFLVESVEGGR